ncbi:hypothetical protein FGLOB1_12071 [Fusarium globosum]|uniref:Uncharacterized protein n=1 Tax=Fusarium globosum TaxID=78864 RepID=A0A8H5XR68_9HYPO|nr:hypothetical protein FGLOB1_12071 [Fusarium globosum]
MPTQILVARNSTGNTTNTTTKAKDSPIFNPDSEGIISLAILAGILAFFVGLVLRDLLDRRRTGEFKEDKRSCRRFFRTLFHLPCLMCSKDNWKQLWIKFANLFRSKANQRVVKKADQDGIELAQRLENGKTVGTFNGAWSPKPASTRKSGSKGKAVDTTVLPQVADFSVDHGQDGQGFESTPVRGASSGSIRHSSSEHDNALGIYNPRDLYAEQTGSSSTNHHHGAGSSSASAGRSHWWSSGHGHGTSYSHSHSNSHSHDHGSHSHDFGHTDSGGFDGCHGGGD